jgi:hypothetical protein
MPPAPSHPNRFLSGGRRKCAVWIRYSADACGRSLGHHLHHGELAKASRGLVRFWGGLGLGPKSATQGHRPQREVPDPGRSRLIGSALAMAKVVVFYLNVTSEGKWTEARVPSPQPPPWPCRTRHLRKRLIYATLLTPDRRPTAMFATNPTINESYCSKA